MKTLLEIFDLHNTDKGTTTNRSDRVGHRYDRVYEPALEHLRDKELLLLEVGILKGNSLAAWVDFFPYATIMGIDIFTRVPAEDVPILKNSRVEWCNCNSVKGPNQDFLDLLGDRKIDVIIDDGLHNHISQKQTFENFFPFLKEDGVYFIEDVWPFDIMTDNEKQHNWMITHPDVYSDSLYNDLLTAIKPYTIKFHDLRAESECDSYIIEVRK